MTTKSLYIPTLKDIEKARDRISQYLLKAPLRHSSALSKLTGTEVYIKYENHNPTCAFKVRDSVNFVSKLVSSGTYKGEKLLAGSIHGDKSQAKRERVLKLFKTNQLQTLVTTDVAARGLDIADINPCY